MKSLRSTFLLVFGILFAILGIGGFWYSTITDKTSPGNGNYRYIIKDSVPIQEPIVPTEIIIPTPEAIKSNEIITPTSSTLAQVKQNPLDLDSFLIHSDENKELEQPYIPDRIEIPAIKLIAPVVISGFNFTDIEGETFGQWVAPSEFAAGWHSNSALLGKRGNTVISGHHNEYGEVFGHLVDLKEGDLVYVYSRDKQFTFIIANRMILPERNQPPEVRFENAKWLAQTDDVRLTLVTCWPASKNTHRLILVARPFLSVVPLPKK
jgi:LPXTG-site transpeptidase (sortase) family protein